MDLGVYTRKGLCLSEKMWLSVTMVLIFDSSWSLYIRPLWPTKYWKNTTACLQHKPQTGCHKTVETNTYQWLLLRMVKTIRFDLKWKKHYLHSTTY